MPTERDVSSGTPEWANGDGLLDALFERALCLLEGDESISSSRLAAEFRCGIDHAERALTLAASVLGGAGLLTSEPPPRVAGFEIIGELGRGGMSVVYTARQRSLGGRVVALKVLPAAVSLSPSARTRFREEARAIAKFRHPNIVAIYEVVEQPSVCAYAMELVEGLPLSSHIGRVSGGGTGEFLELAQVARIGADVARALGVVHEMGLVHRDVKPSNILIRRDGTPLLSDFGVVRGTGSSVETLDGAFIGTPAYASPEQLRGDHGALDQRSDVYSLGATLYHACAGIRPCEGHSPASFLTAIERAAIPPLRKVRPECSRDIESVIAKAMDPDPARRYRTAAELADDLDRVRSFRAVRARPAGPLTRTHRVTRRHRRSLAGATAGALAMIAAVVFGWAVLVHRPAVAAERLDAARLSLIDPSQGTKVALRLMWGDGTRPGDVLAADLERSLSLYDAAITLDPLATDVRREAAVVRAVVRLAHDGKGAEELVGYSSRIPATVRYATDFSTPASWDTVSPLDARDLGFAALLLGDVDVALLAWARVERAGELDPFIEATLGQVHLWRGEPGRAYPRLQRAAEAFPNVGFLHVLLADAAVRVGDLDRAEMILARALAMGGHDSNSGAQRVRADLLAAQGHADEARALYRAIMGDNPVAALHLGRLLESEGDRPGAMEAYRADRFLIAESAERFLALAQRPGHQRGVLSPLHAWVVLGFGTRAERDELLALLRDAQHAVHRLQESRENRRIPSTLVQPTSAPLDTRADVARLLTNLEVDNMTLWNELNRRGSSARSLAVTGLMCGVSSETVLKVARFRRVLQAALAASVVGAAPAALAADPIEFFEGDFGPGSYTVETRLGGQGTASIVTTVADGGTPGPYLRVQHVLEDPQPPMGWCANWVWSFVLFEDAVIDPSAIGGIESIDFEMASLRLNPTNPGSGQRETLVIRQGGELYRTGGNIISTDSWSVSPSVDLSAEDFARVINEPPCEQFVAGDIPDFSPSGGPIQFGFARGTSTGPLTVNAQTVAFGADAWSVTVHPAGLGPTPCNVADLAQPFGILDITDVDAFIDFFLAGDPAADLAPNFGIIDIVDIDAFILAFLDGCP